MLTAHPASRKKQAGKRFRIALVGLLIPLGVLLAADPQQVEKTFDTTANPRISLSNLAGQVVVRGWDKNQVHATYTAPSPRVEVDTVALPPTGPAEKIHFNTHVLDPQSSSDQESVDYALEIPAGSSLEIRNRQGSVRVEKLRGNAWVDAVGATVAASDVGGHLVVRSLGGNIELFRPSGLVEASSITGNLRFVSASGPKLRGTTTSGKITYEGDFVPGADYILSSYSGDLDIFCPPSASFELNAKTVRGKLDNAFPLTPRRHAAVPFGSASSLLGTHSTGNATLELTSFSGTIRIRQQR